MKPDQVKIPLAVIMPLMFAVACGGGGDAGTNAATPGTGEATNAEQTITGRVADGYLQGAIVCIDINENGQCDPDEPQVESGAGGTYSLDLSANAAGKPILAEVPATAIDEDTGMPIGKELLLSTPGDKPEFVSPITTLVHQEIKNNPNLDTNDAAATVLEILGLPDEEGGSVFTDYVAGSDAADEQRREKYKFIHQTARVVASMMDEFHENVVSAAREQGIDVDSEETSAAIRELVREEIRGQLPDISAAVAERILQIEESGSIAGGQPVELTDRFDPDAVSEGLGEREWIKDIAEKIEATKEEAPAMPVNMDALLAAGIYMINLDCEHRGEYGREDGLVEPVEKSVILNDEGMPEVVSLPEHCRAGYSHIITEAIVDAPVDGTLDDEDSSSVVPDTANLIITHYHYGFDDSTGSKGWIKDEQTREKRPHLLTLIGGDWLPVENDGPYGEVEFTADGAAIMHSDLGKLLVYASGRDLSGKSVLRHMLSRSADEKLADLVDESLMFPDQSSVNMLHIKRNASLITMFNWYPKEDDTGVDHCADLGGNCNVVYLKNDASQSSMPVTSLDDLIDGSMINAIAYDEHNNLPIDLTLHMNSGENDAATSDEFDGYAKWMVAPQASGIEPAPGGDAGPGNEPTPGTEPGPDPISEGEPMPIPSDNCPAECPQPVDQVQMVCMNANNEMISITVPVDVPEYSAEAQLAIQQNGGILENGEEVAIPLCPLPPSTMMPDGTLNDFSPADSANAQEGVIGESRWRRVTVQGVDMIAIEVPVSVRHRMGDDEIAELLLLQEGEFVRRGARVGEHSVDDETAYNGSAFDTLLPVIVDYVEPHVTEPVF